MNKMEKQRQRRSKSVSGIEGVHQNQKHKAPSRLSSVSYDESIRDDMFTLDLGQGSFRRATGMPKLPTEDMYNEYRVHREQKMLTDSYRQKNVSSDIEPDRELYEIRSSRRSTMKQQEFIDVHEDPRRSSRWSRRSMLTESDMEFMQKLKKSIEQDDVIDERDSKESREFDRQRSYSIVNSADFEGNSKSWMLERDTIGGIGGSNGSLLIEPRNVPRAHTSPKSSKAQLEEKNDARSTRIVVLRPNPGDMQSEGMSGSSPYDSHGYVPNYRKMKEYSSIGDAERVSRRRKDASCNVGFSRPVSEEAKKIARKITRRMRGGCNEAVDAWFRRYAGEKDSYGDIGSDSENESEVFRLSSRNSFSDGKKWGISPSSGPVEPSVKKDAKKRLSERWKLTQRYQELEIVGKGSTLGEMLGIPDGETSFKSYAKTNQSGNGVNDKIHRTSSRSRSLPPSVGRKTHSRGAYDNRLSEEQHLMHNDPISCGRNKVGKGKLSHKEYSSSQDLKCRNKKSLPRQHLYMNGIGSSSEANFEIQMEPNVKDLSETPIQMDEKDDKRRTPVIIYERKRTTFSSKSSVLQPKQSSIIDDTYKAAGHDQKDFFLQELHKGPPKEGSPSLVYSEISKEANHASPVSVLQSPSIGNTSSSSKGFEEVSAALNDLRTQLQLLKTESDSYDETTLVPIEEDIVQLSSMLPKSWKLSYALDVLIHSGLQEFGFDMSMMMWHSPDSPLDPRLFDKLEKKYGDCETNELRVERKLLFDRINSAVLDIFQQQLDFCPWVKPKLAELPSMSPKERAVAALEKLINQEPPIEQAPGKILVDKEMLFRDSKGEINLLGNDIEKLLIDEMIIEFFV